MAGRGRCLARLVLGFGLGCAFGSLGWAQTGSLRGQVLDGAGEGLPGATVLVSSAGLGVGERGVVTDKTGAFRVESLPPGGDYVVLVSLTGYAAVRVSEVEVQAGRAATLRVTLERETALRQKVEVKARPQVVNLEETTTETRFGAEFIEGLPLLGRDYQDLLTLAPGVSDVNGTGNPNIHGARDTDVITLVDGVSTTDPLTGKVGAQLNIESIQEIEVKTSGATAEYSRAQGGFANIITKSGGNEFRGTFKFFWRGSYLDRGGAGADDPRLHAGVGEHGLRDLRFNDYLPFLAFEGPIVRDHAWFYVANEYVQREDPVNAVSAAFVTGVREFREFAKLTWQAGANHRLALSLNYDPQSFLNQGLNSLTREESGFTLRQGGPVLTLKDTAVLSPLVALETSLSSFDERPARVPNLGPDTNHNGILFVDRNKNGTFEASERDAGEDYDNDGVFDVFEDLNHDYVLGTTATGASEDLDGDKHLTPYQAFLGAQVPLGGGCEGKLREDIDCDGHLDNVNEDVNHNGKLDPGEDLDGDHYLDLGTEDRNHNGKLDDTPRPTSLYPYGELRPLPRDRDYSIDQRAGITSGPFYSGYSDRRQRFTLRQDLSIHVPDFAGSHDLKFGGVYEREGFDRAAQAREITAPLVPPPRQAPGHVQALVPVQTQFDSHASASTFGLYAQDNYKPLPNLSIGLGMRFDRELIDSSGYTYFDPASQATLFGKLSALAGGERGQNDLQSGNGDGILSLGIQSDPMLNSDSGLNDAAKQILGPLKTSAIARLTRYHADTDFLARTLSLLFPELQVGGRTDPKALAAHGVVAQQKEPFALTNNNLAPRLSIAWDPGSDGRTKLFATWGRFYDRLFLNTVVGEQGPDYMSRYYFYDPIGLTSLGPDHNIGDLISKAPPSITQVARGLNTPYSDELTLGFEREIVPEVAISLTYINRRFLRQLQGLDVNHTLKYDPATGKPFDLIGQRANDTQTSDGLPDLYIYNPFFNQVLRLGNYNKARYHGLELSFVRRLSRRWELQGSYTYSRAVGDAEDFQARFGNDPSTIQTRFGYLDYDQRHVVKLNFATFLPHDWRLGFLAGWGSGLPYSIITRAFSLDNQDYPQLRTFFGVPGQTASGSQFQSLRRNGFRNPAAYDFNVRASKAVVLGHQAASLFIEVFNLLNTDDLRIFTYQPKAPGFDDRRNPTPSNPFDPVSGTAIQLDAQRRFGRRWQVGIQFDF